MTTTIQFYHLLTTPLESALPRLMEKALSTGMHTLVRVRDEPQMQRLDDALWSYQEGSFLPHGHMHDPHPAQQPIYLTTGDDNPNGAKLLALTSGELVDSPADYQKIFDLFDGHDGDAVAAARTRWAHYKEAGHQLSYVQQQKGGGWKQMATANEPE